MLRYTLLILAAVAVAGCASEGPLEKMSGTPSSAEQAQLAAQAASVEYPMNTKSAGQLQSAAIVNRDKHTITIRNFGDQNLQNVNVWVNGAYVRHVDSLPSHSAITINEAQFYNRQGTNLLSDMVSVNKVQVQSNNQLWDLQGPQVE